MASSQEFEHAAKIERLLKINPRDLEAVRLQEIISAIKKNELTEIDVLRFTNITAKQLQVLLELDENC